MSQRDLPGQFEQMVLLAVARLDGGAHGMAIHEELLAVTGRDVSVPALYVTLSRLEKKGLVAATVEEPTVHEGGRVRKCYRLEPAGAEALTRSREVLDGLWEGVDLPGTASK